MKDTEKTKWPSSEKFNYNSFLFLLRAYGDFVILLQALMQSPQKNKYTIIASKHLQTLYEELASFIDLTSIQIQFINSMCFSKISFLQKKIF